MSLSRFLRCRELRRVAAAALAGASIAGAQVAKADFNDGVLALVTGQYEQALATFMPLAETNDDPWSQYFLGRMYANGQGVEQDFESAAKYYRKAAEKGIHDAQYRLGRLYAAGRGVPVDYEYAYGWYSVASHLGNPKAAGAREAAAQNLTPEQLVEAKKLSEQLIGEFGEPVDAHRATKRLSQ